MAQLPEPSFINRDANTVTSELVACYEGLTGKTLQPAQPEMLLINLVAYRETLLRIAVQEAAKQNLVSYAIFPMLDYLGELVGCTRLAAACARCTLRFTLVAAQSFDVLVAAGTRVESKDGKVIFASEFNVTIPAGQVFGDISAVAETSGIAGNGYLPGEINTLLQTVAYVQNAANTVTTSGGSIRTAGTAAGGAATTSIGAAVGTLTPAAFAATVSYASIKTGQYLAKSEASWRSTKDLTDIRARQMVMGGGPNSFQVRTIDAELARRWQNGSNARPQPQKNEIKIDLQIDATGRIFARSNDMNTNATIGGKRGDFFSAMMNTEAM